MGGIVNPPVAGAVPNPLILTNGDNTTQLNGAIVQITNPTFQAIATMSVGLLRFQDNASGTNFQAAAGGASVSDNAANLGVFAPDRIGVSNGPIGAEFRPDGIYIFRNSSAFRTREIAQIQRSNTGAVATGTTIIPFDNTVPQQTEGDQYLSVSITPKDSASTLHIEVEINLSSSAAASENIAALFQDANANALKAAAYYQATANVPETLKFSLDVISGSTVATTFKVRAGGNAASTITLNGQGGVQLFGGVFISSIVVTEYLP